MKKTKQKPTFFPDKNTQQCKNTKELPKPDKSYTKNGGCFPRLFLYLLLIV